MERSNLKILRTIFGLPSRTSSLGLHFLSGTVPVSQMLLLKQTSFVRQVLALPDGALARSILIHRANEPTPPISSLIHRYNAALETLSLPPIVELIHNLPTKAAWKALTKTFAFEIFYENFLHSSMPSLTDAIQLPLPLKYGQPPPIVFHFRHNLKLSRLSNLRFRLLLHVSSLASDTSSFNAPPDSQPRLLTCLLCSQNAIEDINHFIYDCPSLQHIRNVWFPRLYKTPPSPPQVINHVLGIEWLDDQESILSFAADLYCARAKILQSFPPPGYSSHSRRQQN